MPNLMFDPCFINFATQAIILSKRNGRIRSAIKTKSFAVNRNTAKKGFGVWTPPFVFKGEER